MWPGSAWNWRARLLFGSATPSLENWLLSQQDNAAMGLLELRDRIAARPCRQCMLWTCAKSWPAATGAY